MKKIYINPRTEVLQIETQSMIAGSLDPEGLKGTVFEEQVSDGTAAEGRSSFWDED